MSDENEEKRSKIAEIHRKISNNLVLDANMELAAPEQKMLELLRVDTLMRSMRFFVENGRADDEALGNFVVAYRGSAPLIYGKGIDAGYENVLKNVRDSIRVSGSFLDYKDISFPEAAGQIEKIRGVLSGIVKSEQEIKELGSAKKGKSSGVKREKDVEAEEILLKIAERIKKQDSSAKIAQFSYGSGEVMVKTASKKGQVTSIINGALLGILNNPKGVERLNNLLVEQGQKSSAKASVKADNEKIKEAKKAIEEKIEKDKKKFKLLQDELNRKMEEYLRKLPARELLGAFAARDEAGKELRDVLSNCANFDELKGELVKSFKEDRKTWSYVEGAQYYDMAKDLARIGYNKDSIVYKAMPSELKELLLVRGIELYGLKNPDRQSVEEMNGLLNKYGYRVSLQKVKVSSGRKSGKSGAKTADDILAKATQPEGEAKLSPYNRRYMTLGLMYCIGEGAGKNDDMMLFKKYMQVYFDERDASAVDAVRLEKEYGWEDFKKSNAQKAQAVYKEFSKNAGDVKALKDGLLSGTWAGRGINSVHHNLPRRFGECSSNPEEMNNQPNLAVTVQWNAWEKDNHQLEHFFNMSQHDGALSYLTVEKGDYVRKGEVNGLSEVYYEKPQVKKDGKWADLIPEDTLLVTSNITVGAPELPNHLKHKAIKSFGPVSILDKESNLSYVSREKAEAVTIC